MTDRSNGYEAVAAEFLAGRGGPKSAGIGAATVRAWARTLPPGGAVLDLGCGSGVPITQALIEQGLNVHAVDAAPSLVAAFRARFPDTPIACEAVEDSPFFDRTFEAIVSWGLVFLLPADAQRALLDRVASALVPGGRLLFTSPRQAVTWTDAMTGRLSLSLGSKAYSEQLANAGLTVIRVYDDEGENNYYDVLKPHRKGSNAERG